MNRRLHGEFMGYVDLNKPTANIQELIMQSFNEWRSLKESNSTTVYSINELIERLDDLGPNFSVVQVFKILPEELNQEIQKARTHYDMAISILKSVAFKKDEKTGEYFGDREFGRSPD